MNPLETSHRPADADRVAAISRLVRRVCLLREQGDLAGASEIESTRLEAAVRTLREEAGAEALTNAGLEKIYEVERTRVAEAEILCELLVPRLSGAMPAIAQPAAPRRSLIQQVPDRQTTAEAGSPEIPDLLDAMLAAERTGRRNAPHARRES